MQAGVLLQLALSRGHPHDHDARVRTHTSMMARIAIICVGIQLSGEHSLAHRHEPMGRAHAARARADPCALV